MKNRPGRPTTSGSSHSKQIYFGIGRRSLLAQAQELWPDRQSDSQMMWDALQYMVDKELRRLDRAKAKAQQ